MAVQEVACPGCQATLKAPDNMAGKKAKCKKCGAAFRIPGGTPSGDTVGEGQLLGTHDLPSPPPPTKKPPPLPKPVATADRAPPKAKSGAPTAPKPDDEPAPEPFSFDDDAGLPAVAPSKPFSFDGAAPVAKGKLPSIDENAVHPPRPVGYRAKPGGIGKLILSVVVFGLVVGGAIGGVIYYLDYKKGIEQASHDSKDDKKGGDPLAPARNDSPANKGDGKVGEPAPKSNEKILPNMKDPVAARPKTGGSKGGMLALSPGRTIQFTPQAPTPEKVQDPTNRHAIIPQLAAKTDSIFALARKFFPPQKANLDIGVVWQTGAPLDNRGEQLTLGIYSPLSGRQVNQVAIEGDASAEPVCDLSVSADLFAHAHTADNKITVWDTRKQTKVIDGFAPYADKKKKDLKLAAIYLSEPPDKLITVSTSGMVHAFKVPSKEPIPGEFSPAKIPTKPLAAGKSIAPGPSHQSVILVSGGTVYAVSVKGSVSGSVATDLGGDVGRSLGLAASGGGRVLFAFETDADNKKEKAIMAVRPNGKHVFYRWTERDAGELVVAGWAGEDVAMIGTDRGAAIWFEADRGFLPLALARTPNDAARHVGADGHWALLPDPADPKKCVLVEFARPQQGIVGVLGATKEPPTVLLNEKGLFK